MRHQPTAHIEAIQFVQIIVYFDSGELKDLIENSCYASRFGIAEYEGHGT